MSSPEHEEAQPAAPAATTTNSLTKPILVGLAIVAIGIAGYFANEQRVCQGLQDRYVSNVKTQADMIELNARISALGVPDTESPEEAAEANKLRHEAQKIAIDEIHERCGFDAVRGTIKRSQEVLDETTRNILSMPVGS